MLRKIQPVLSAPHHAERASSPPLPRRVRSCRRNDHNVSLADSAFLVPNLSASDERRLLEVVHSEQPEPERQAALSELWLCYTKLVIMLASRYRGLRVDVSDLISAGQLGLRAAIVGFDLRRTDVRLATYATPWIHYHIQEYVRRNRHPVSLPNSDAHRQLFRSSRRLFDDARRACTHEGIASPTHNELCKRVGARIGLSEYEVERSLQLTGDSHVSFDAPTFRNAIHAAQSATYHSRPEVDINQDLDVAEARYRISVLAKTILGASERHVFERRYSRYDEPARLDELAVELGVTRERIYQLEASAKRKIAAALIAQGFAEAGALEAMKSVRSRGVRRSAKHPTQDGPCLPQVLPHVSVEME